MTWTGRVKKKRRGGRLVGMYCQGGVDAGAGAGGGGVVGVKTSRCFKKRQGGFKISSSIRADAVSIERLGLGHFVRSVAFFQLMDAPLDRPVGIVLLEVAQGGHGFFLIARLFGRGGSV